MLLAKIDAGERARGTGSKKSRESIVPHEI